jgi:hypothetical protein
MRLRTKPFLPHRGAGVGVRVLVRVGPLAGSPLAPQTGGEAELGTESFAGVTTPAQAGNVRVGNASVGPLLPHQSPRLSTRAGANRVSRLRTPPIPPIPLMRGTAHRRVNVATDASPKVEGKCTHPTLQRRMILITSASHPTAVRVTRGNGSYRAPQSSTLRRHSRNTLGRKSWRKP